MINYQTLTRLKPCLYCASDKFAQYQRSTLMWKAWPHGEKSVHILTQNECIRKRTPPSGLICICFTENHKGLSVMKVAMYQYLMPYIRQISIYNIDNPFHNDIHASHAVKTHVDIDWWFEHLPMHIKMCVWHTKDKILFVQQWKT